MLSPAIPRARMPQWRKAPAWTRAPSPASFRRKPPAGSSRRCAPCQRRCRDPVSPRTRTATSSARISTTTLCGRRADFTGLVLATNCRHCRPSSPCAGAGRPAISRRKTRPCCRPCRRISLWRCRFAAPSRDGSRRRGRLGDDRSTGRGLHDRRCQGRRGFRERRGCAPLPRRARPSPRPRRPVAVRTPRQAGRCGG